jgi:catechol 2,3-dioxygenase-like lactoylglutathione lyase family enzyme
VKRTGNVLRLVRVSRTVSDLAKSAAFYRDALGFSIASEMAIDDPAWGPLMGIPDARGQSIMMRLGKQELELVAFDPPGRPYPRANRSTDLRFQHAAIVVSDMDQAYANLCRYPFDAITMHGPQHLPPNTGSVTAFKFRDPDGHPLELIHFPVGIGDAGWQKKRGVLLGIDHSAISVADVQLSIDFYTHLLGMGVGSRSVNSGMEQERLDGVRGAVVDVVALQLPDGRPPHVELLGYRRSAARHVRRRTLANDVIADRLVLQVDDLPHLAAALKNENVEFVSAGIATLRDGGHAMLVRDPTGHMLQLIE